MAQTANDILTLNMETVRKKLPEIYEMGATAYNKLSKSAEKFRISKTPNSADFRAPFKYMPPAGFGTMSLEGGSLGTGNGFKANQFVQTYFPLVLSVDVNLASVVATSGGANLSVVNSWKENMKEAIPSFQRFADASFHNIGGNTGKIIDTTTNLSTYTYTCESAFSANLLQVGQPVEIVSSGGTWRTSGVSPDGLPFVSAVDKTAGTFTLDSTIASGLTLATGDVFYFKGAVTTGPAYSWVTGLYYFHDTAASGNILGVDRTLYDIKPNLVNAASTSLVPAHAWQLKAKIRQRRGIVNGKFMGLIHDAQAAQVRTLGLAISEIQIPNGQAFKAADIAGGYGDTIMFGDVEHLVDVHQSKTRLDWLLPNENWCRVYGQELDFFKTPEGKMIFEGRNASGTTTAKYSFYLTTQENLVCADPGREGAIYGLSIPSGF